MNNAKLLLYSLFKDILSSKYGDNETSSHQAALMVIELFGKHNERSKTSYETNTDFYDKEREDFALFKPEFKQFITDAIRINFIILGSISPGESNSLKDIELIKKLYKKIICKRWQ